MPRTILSTLLAAATLLPVAFAPRAARAHGAAGPGLRTPDLSLGNALARDPAGAGPQAASLASPLALTTFDQQNTAGGSTASTNLTGAGPGQSFTPIQSTMNAATFSLATTSGTTTMQLQVYAGSGLTGTLLATGPAVTYSNTALQNVELPLSSPLTLTPGSTYTIQAYLTAGSFSIGYSNSNPYPGGTYFSNSGISVSSLDLVFAEGTDAALAVPEPSTWASLGLGVAGLGVVTLRRRRRA